MKRSVIFLVALQFLLINCSEDEVPKKASGYFTLSRLSTSSGKTRSEATADFDLGAVKASREFLFMLGNGGQNPITDITLTTNDPAYVVSPERIATLDGISTATNAIIPIISVGVTHGTHLNGIGYTDLLDMGEHSLVLTITGKTIENGVEIDVESEFEFVFNAKVLNVTLIAAGEEVDFSEPTSVGSMVGYGVPSDRVTFHNTGNVEMKVVAVSNQDDSDVRELTIAPDESKDLIISTEENPITSYLISIDGGGTISDYKKFLIGIDGKIYFDVYTNFPPEE